MYILNEYHNDSANVRCDSFDRFTTSNKIRQMLFHFDIPLLIYLYFWLYTQTHKIKWYEFRNEMPIPCRKSKLVFIPNSTFQNFWCVFYCWVRVAWIQTHRHTHYAYTFIPFNLKFSVCKFSWEKHLTMFYLFLSILFEQIYVYSWSRSVCCALSFSHLFSFFDGFSNSNVRCCSLRLQT